MAQHDACDQRPASPSPGARASIKIVKSFPAIRVRHQKRVARLKCLLAQADLPVMPSSSHIVPLLVGNAVACRDISENLLRRHAIYVQPINCPTVPRGTERLRLTPSPVHSDQDMVHLVAGLTESWVRCANAKLMNGANGSRLPPAASIARWA